MAGYSFRFYGRKPTHFAEGGSDGHLFSVQWQRTPDDVELEKIGALYERRLSTGIASPSYKAWRWSDRFAAFTVGERWISNGAHIGAVTDFLMDSHKIVPIVDVVYHNANDGVGRWDQWSLTQGPPDAGPDFGRSVCPAFNRPIDASFPAPAAHPVFEKGRQDDVTMRATSKVEDILCAERKAGKVGLSRLPDPIEAPTPNAEWPPEVLEKFEIPEQEHQGKDNRGHMVFSPGDHIALSRVRRPFAFIRNKGGYAINFCWLDDEGVRKSPAWSKAESEWGSAEWKHPGPLHPEGDKVLAMSKHESYLVDLKTSAVTHIHSCDSNEDGLSLLDVFWLDGGTRVGVRSDKRVCVFDPSTTPPMKMTCAARMKSSYGANLVAMNGKVLVTSDMGKNPRVSLVSHDKIKNAGTFKATFDDVFETEGRLILCIGAGETSAHYEVTHIDEVYEKFAAPLRKKASGKAKAVARPSAPKVKLQLTPVDPQAVPRSIEEEVLRRFGLEDTHGQRPKRPPKTEHRTSAGGEVELCLVREGTPAYERLTLETLKVGVGGKIFDVDVAERRFMSAEITPDGSRLYITAVDGVHTCTIGEDGLGELQHLDDPQENFYNVIALAKGKLLLKAWKHLHLYESSEDGNLTFLHKLPLKDTYTMTLIRDLNAVIAIGEDAKKKAWVVGVLGEKIKAVGTFSTDDYKSCVVQGGRVWLSAGKSKNSEIEGLAETVKAKKLEQG